MKNIFELSVASILPKHCAYCDKLIAGDKTACKKCLSTLPRIKGEICKKCGIEKPKCDCKNRENYFDGIVAPFYYEGNVRKGLHNYKFRRSLQNANIYSVEMANTIKERYSDIKFDYIAIVPSTKKRIKNSGFDHIEILAKKLSKQIDVPLESDVLSKIYETNIQHGLSAIMRRGNLAAVFDVKNPEKVEGKTILLCDDITTSGETLNECAKMLWLYGAEKIYCVALAITAPKKPKSKR